VNVANGVVVPLDQDGVQGDDLVVSANVNRAHVVIDVLGYFSPLTLSDGPGSLLDADTVDGLHASDLATAAHTHDGAHITTGTVADARIATSIARDVELMPTVLANDGPGSTLNADLLDNLSSTAFQRRYARVATVAVAGTGDYADPVAAMADLATWCGVPNGFNRCLLRITPGEYYTTAAVTVPNGVDIEGSGSTMTVLWRTTAGAAPAPALVVQGGGAVRNIAVIADGGTNVVALRLEAPGRVLNDVYVAASAATGSATAIQVVAGSHLLEDTFAITFGGASTVRTVEVIHEPVNGTSLRVRNSEMWPGSSDTAADCVGILSGGSLDFEGSRIFAGSCGNNSGVRTTATSGALALRGCRMQIGGWAQGAGLETTAGKSATVKACEIGGTGALGYGILHQGGNGTVLDVQRSQLSGTTNAIRSTGSATIRVQHSVAESATGPNYQAISVSTADFLYVGASQLTNRAVSTGVAAIRCYVSYDSQMFALPADCSI
jgi:hypothetical protein